MSVAQNIYSEINRIANKKRSSESNLQELKERKEQKLLECDRKKIEVIREYLSGADSILNSISTDSNQLSQLESTAMGSITPINDSLTELRAYLERKFTTLDEKFTERFNVLDGKVNTLDGKVNTLDRKVNTLDGKVNTLDRKVNTLDGKVNTLDRKVNTLDGKVNALDGKVNALDGKVNTLDGKVNALDGKVNTLDGKVNALDGKVSLLDGKVNTLDGKVNALDGKVSLLDGNFAQHNSQIIRFQNIILNKDGEDVITVPFLDGTKPEDHGLPQIRTVLDIDRLSRDQCHEFLTGYGVSFRDSESINLKKKIRETVGFSLGTALKYSFQGFDNE